MSVKVFHIVRLQGAFALIVLLLAAGIGCKGPVTISRSVVSDSLKAATGFDLQRDQKPDVKMLPPDVRSLQGLTEDEAVSIALWNNAQLQADLATIAVSQADVLNAGIVSNPLLRYLAPGGGLNVSGYINFAFDFLFQRQKRIAAAQADATVIASTALQRSYALIRDVQVAYTDLAFSRERHKLLAENAAIRSGMADLTNSRLRNGDISELEATTMRADSATAEDDVVRAALDTAVKKSTLAVLMGFSPDTNFTIRQADLFTDTQSVELSAYQQLAFDYQPELRAARQSIEAIGKRLGWERSRVIAFIPTLNFQHLPAKGGSKFLPNSFNPGIQAEIPLLNRNQAGIAKAKAEMESAAYRYVAVRQRIALETELAYQRYRQAWESYRIWSTGTLVALEEAVTLSLSSYRNGDISYLPVLEAQRQLINGKLRRIEIQADLRRNISALNFSIGNKWNN